MSYQPYPKEALTPPPPRTSVDIVMPTMNAAKYLIEAIESILAQTVQDWNLIVLDGGSTDATQTIADYYSRNDSRIHVIIDPGSHPTTRINNWLTKSQADLIAFQHADDVSAPARIERMTQAFARDPGLLLLGTATHYWLHAKTNPGSNGYAGHRRYPQHHAQIRARLPFYWCFALPSIMFRRQPVIDHGLFFNEKIRYCADYDWYYRMSGVGRVDNLPDFLVSYRHHEESDGPRNRPELERESEDIRRSIVRAEFPKLSDEDETLLSQVRFEPECVSVNSSQLIRLKTLLHQRAFTMEDPDTRAACSIVYAEYIKSIAPVEFNLNQARKKLKKWWRKLRIIPPSSAQS